MGAGGGRSGEESPEDGKRKKTWLLRTHHEKRGNMLGESHHAGHNAGKSEKRKTENKLVGQHKGMDWIDNGGIDKTDGRQESEETLEEYCS